MDETALIAFGILMEETAREILGETGDFAFVEAANEEDEQAFDPGDEPEETGADSSRSREVSVESEHESTSEDSRFSSEDSN